MTDDSNHMSAAEVGAGTVKILLVDDTPHNLKALEALLDGPDRSILTASAGGDAVRILMHQDVAVILLDVRMDGMDGYETARLIRSSARFQSVPIIFITATSPSMTDLEQGYSLGAVDFIFKPVAPSIIKAKINGFVALAKRAALMPCGTSYHESIGLAARLLIIDDDEALLEVLPTILQTRIPGLHIDLALTAKQGLERLASESYGAIIIDVRMAGTSGIRLLEEARRIQPLTPVLLMTGDVGDHPRKAFNAGAFDCLLKPFDAATLAMAVKRALESYVSRRREHALETLLSEVTPGLIELESLALALSQEMAAPAEVSGAKHEKVTRMVEQLVNLCRSPIRVIRDTITAC
jgi:CheY-like chemotaxis protein